jgi:hypothetical protein
VDKFSKTLGKSDNHWLKKRVCRLASVFVFLLAKPEFYSHLESWRVVIRTCNYALSQPVICLGQESKVGKTFGLQAKRYFKV